LIIPGPDANFFTFMRPSENHSGLNPWACDPLADLAGYRTRGSATGCCDRPRRFRGSLDLEAVIEVVLAVHPSDVQDFCSGNAKVQGFLMGLVMKASQGKANPKLVKELLAKRLA
jgi:hypothetical protein